MPGALTVKNQTFFKLIPQQSGQLPTEQKYEVYPGQKFLYMFVDSGKYNGHLKIYFSQPIMGIYTWFIESRDVELTDGSATYKAVMGAGA